MSEILNYNLSREDLERHVSIGMQEGIMSLVKEGFLEKTVAEKFIKTHTVISLNKYCVLDYIKKKWFSKETQDESRIYYKVVEMKEPE